MQRLENDIVIQINAIYHSKLILQKEEVKKTILSYKFDHFSLKREKCCLQSMFY